MFDLREIVRRNASSRAESQATLEMLKQRNRDTAERDAVRIQRLRQFVAKKNPRIFREPDRSTPYFSAQGINRVLIPRKKEKRRR